MLHGRSYSLSSDIYSLTMVLWEILTCSAPFDEVSDEDMTEVLMSGATPAIPAWTPQPFRDLLSQGWSRNPDLRPSAPDLLRKLRNMLQQLEQEFQLQPLDPSVFFLPNAREEAYAHQMYLYQLQQQQEAEFMQQQMQQQQHQQQQQQQQHFANQAQQRRGSA